MQEYTKAYSNFGLTPPWTVPNPDSLTLAISASSITIPLNKIDIDGDTDQCIFTFDEALYEPDLSTFNSIVANHTGQPPPQFIFHTSSKLVENVIDVTDPDWANIGGVVTTIGAFISDPTKAWGRVIGQAEVVGDGASIRLIRGSTGVLLSQEQVISESGDWANIQFWANQNQFLETDAIILQAKLNGATSFRVRYFSMSLLELII